MLTEPSKTYKPMKYPWCLDFWEQSEKLHWGPWEAELQEDVKQWKGSALSAAEKNHITQILRLFTQSDANVAGNYCDQFIPYFRNNEVRLMLLSFAARETVHQVAYALLNDTLGMDESEYSVFLTNPDMRTKMEFMCEEPMPALPAGMAAHWEAFRAVHMARQLAKAVCNEGMSLFSAFAMLMSYQRFGKMKGMCEIVRWSVVDESIHLAGMTRLFQEFCKEHPEVVNDELKRHIYDMYRHAVDLEDKIIDIAFEMGPIQGLTADEMKQYIRYIADRRLIGLGLKANWNIETNPLPWLDHIMSGDSHTNFFEGRPTEYTAGGLTGDWGWS